MKQIVFLLFVTSLLTNLARSGPTPNSQGQHEAKGRPYQGETGVVAVVEPGREITIEEVDQSIGKALYALKEKIFILRKNAIESLIIRTVLESEAKEAGFSIDELKKRLTKSDGPVTQAQIEGVFAENLAVFSTLSEDEAKEKIRLDLENQGRLRTYRARVAELKDRARIRLYLKEPEPERVAVSKSGPFFGPAEAPVTIYEYSDFQCPYCRQAAATIKKVLERYQGKVRVVFKHLPLPIHPQAFNAAQAAHCAREQGGFPAYHDRLFDEANLSLDRLNAIAADLGFNPGRFATCLGSETSRAAVLEDLQEARRLGIQSTPTFILNGRVLRGSIGLAEFTRLIDHELDAKRKEK